MTTTIPVGANGEYLGDRYDRLRAACEDIASDPLVAKADELHNGDALRAFVNTLVDEGVLEGLSEHDANTVIMLVTLGFLKGPGRIAGGIHRFLTEERPYERESDDVSAVCAVMAEALMLYLTAFAAPEFTNAELTLGGLTGVRSLQR